MKSVLKTLVFCLIIAIAIMWATNIKAHEDPLQLPWPKGEKVACFCDNLAIPYDLCLKGIGAEKCFKVKEVKQPVKPKKKECLLPMEPSIHWQDNMLEYSSTSSCYEVSKVDHETTNPLSPSPVPDPKVIPKVPEMKEGDPLPTWPNVIIFHEVLPCHDANMFIAKMQNELGMIPFAQGTGTVRNGQNFEFSAPDMVMLVNIQTGDYMMLGIWPNGLGCVLAGGKNFKPYIVGSKT